MKNYKVSVVNIGYESYDLEKQLLAEIGADLILAPEECWTEELVIEAAMGADAILTREAPITSKVIDAVAGTCKIIARYGVGVDNIDLEAARAKQIYVTNVTDYCSEEVADHGVGLLLACIRQLLSRDKFLRQGKWDADINENIFRTRGKVLGFLGYGNIAQAFHRKWNGFLPSQVLVHDPFVSKNVLKQNGATAADIQTVLSQADYISLNLPLTPETKNIIDAKALKSMKSTAIIINTARGGLIDEAALEVALKEGWILSAGLDVFETEPLNANYPLKRLDNIILTGHMAWYSKDSVIELQRRAAEEVKRVLTGQLPLSWVNKW